MVIFEGVAMLMFESFMATLMVVPLAQVFPMDIGRLWITDARPSEDQVQMISLLHHHAAYRRDRCVDLGARFTAQNCAFSAATRSRLYAVAFGMSAQRGGLAERPNHGASQHSRAA